MDATTIHLTLELRHCDECLTGHVVGVHGKAAFSGWLGLIAALDSLVQAHACGELSQDVIAMQGGTP